jgi:hypothetical protein
MGTLCTHLTFKTTLFGADLIGFFVVLAWSVHLD